MAVIFTFMLSRIVHRDLLVHPVGPDVGRRDVRRFGLGTLAYPIATALGLLWPPLTLIAIGVLAVYYTLEQTQLLQGADASSMPRSSRRDVGDRGLPPAIFVQADGL